MKTIVKLFKPQALPRLSLRRLLNVFVGLPMGTLAVAILIQLITSGHQQFQKIAREEAFRTAQTFQQLIQSCLDTHLHVLQDHANYLRIEQPEKHSTDQMAQRLNTLPLLGHQHPLAVLNSNADFCYATSNFPDVNAIRTPQLREALRNNSLASVVEINRIETQFFWQMSVPIQYRDNTIVRLVAEIPVNDLGNWDTMMRALTHHHIELLKGDDTVLSFGHSHSDTAVTLPLDNLGLTLCYATDGSRVLQATTQLAMIGTVIVVCLTVLMILVTSYLGRRWLVRPLEQIGDSVSSLHENNTNIVIPKQPIREIQQLIDQFSDMSQTVHLRTEDLKKERDWARQLFETAEVTMLVLDKKLRVQQINHKGCRLLQLDTLDIIGHNWCDEFIPSDHREQVRNILRQFIDSKEMKYEHNENPVLCLDGQQRMMAWHNNILVDDAGHPQAILSSGLDITEQKNFEKEQNKRLERLHRHQQAISTLVSHHGLPTKDTTQAAQIITEVVAPALKADRVGIWKIDDTSNRSGSSETGLTCVDLFVTEKGTHHQDRHLNSSLFPFFHDLTNQARVLNYEDIESENLSPAQLAYFKQNRIHAILCATIHIHGRLWGILCCDHQEPRCWHTGEMAFAGEICAQVSHALLDSERLDAQENTQKALTEVQQAHAQLKDMQSELIRCEKLMSMGQLYSVLSDELSVPIDGVTRHMKTFKEYVTKIRQVLFAYESLVTTDFEVSQLDTLTLEQIKTVRQNTKIDFVLEDIGNLMEQSHTNLDRLTQIVQNLRSISETEKVNVTG